MTEHINRIAVIGAGAWGTALAQVFAEAGNDITLYARNPDQAEEINSTRSNNSYLKDIKLDDNIIATSNIEDAVKNADIVLMVVPVQFTREALLKLQPHVNKNAFIVNCSKGIEISSGKILSEITKEILPENPYAVLSGPTFAIEVAEGLPTAVTLATLENDEKAKELAQILSSTTFRPYISHDPVGAEIAGAVKNVIAIACGIVAGKELGQNAKASVMTRGMAETKRLGLKTGSNSETFLGLSGIGDLTLTCNSPLSRNYSVGLKLGRGNTLEEIMHNKRTVSEGVSTAKAVVKLAEKLDVEMPICKAVNAILHEGVSANIMIKELMRRHLKAENN